HGVRDRRLDARDLEEILLGLLDTLGDRRRNFLGLAVADADGAVTVADDDEGGEAEPASTLHDLGDPVDRDDALQVRALLRSLATGAALAAVTALAALTTLLASGTRTALRTRHQTAPLFFAQALIRIPIQRRGRRQQRLRDARCTCCRRGRRRPW